MISKDLEEIPQCDVGRETALYYEYMAPWLAPFMRAEIREVLGLMRAAAGLAGRVELHLVDDSQIASLNRQFLGCAGNTNILTFPSDDGEGGCLFLSLDTFARECQLYGQKGETHFLRLLSHGFGHLAGLDHGPRMESIERACFAACQKFIK